MSVDKSPTDTYPMRLLKVGDSITPTSAERAYLVLACWLLHPSDIDAYAVWVVLCHLPHNHHHPFAVWSAYDRPEGWYFANGDYCDDIEQALECYAKRGGKHHL